jgi:maltooligosyltrehalose trehalohydrolase
MTSFAFETSWGGNVTGDGGARFSLWAPGVNAVSLATPTGDLAMAERAEGWFEIETDSVAVGQTYGFRLPSGMVVPDPAARTQSGDVHGRSVLVDPRSYPWQTPNWRGRPWNEAVIYELHTGTFAAEGTFDGVARRLDHLVDLGITALELMPVAQFGGTRGWGYDGVLHYAPHRAYGGAEALKRLIDAAHARSLMVLLDVVYNHFGPDGNYLHLYAPDFFDGGRHTPWGAAIRFEAPAVRTFYIENALYWLEEFRFDGLRLDAIDQIEDPSEEPILEELARTVRERIQDRHVHLTTEDNRNAANLHARGADGAPKLFRAEWNDDFHHVAHVIATGDTQGYYSDYAPDAVAKLARALAQGFVYQGEPSAFRDGMSYGEMSAELPPEAFINFLQNHDQIGNRAFGERLSVLAPEQTLELLTAIHLLSPAIPMLFMGEEWAEERPFLFFTDFNGELGRNVREGRRKEFRQWPQFQDPATRERIPDPNASSTMEASRLDWAARARGPGARRLAYVRALLALRAREIAPRIQELRQGSEEMQTLSERAFNVSWHFPDGSRLRCVASFESTPVVANMDAFETSRALFESEPGLAARVASGSLPSAAVLFEIGRA